MCTIRRENPLAHLESERLCPDPIPPVERFVPKPIDGGDHICFAQVACASVTDQHGPSTGIRAPNLPPLLSELTGHLF